MSNLYQDAILDAKALRASAMANAKAALEEAFQPKIEEMLRLSLSEEIDELADEAELDQDVANMEEMGDKYHEDGMEESAEINEAELEEILAQLEELSGSKDHMEETEESLNEAEEEKDETEEKDEEEEVEDTEEETGDETKVIDLTLGDLKQVIQSVMGGQQDMGVDAMSDDMPTADSETESDISLDEILAELENEGLEEAEHEDKDVNEVEEELEEAKSTIEELRQSLQEVNLLNAKYLYMNKLFKSKTLNESQKVKVVNALDRASSVKEVKNTYETLKESFNSPKKTQLKESIGFASQAAGLAPKQPIIEQDNMMNRWQKLAGIK
jgi:hypothetical protein